MNRRKKRRLKAYVRVYLARTIALCIVLLLMIGSFLLIRTIFRLVTGDERAMETMLDETAEKLIQKRVKRVYERPSYEVLLLPINAYSRPGDRLPEVKDIFVHYTANPGTNAQQNRSYFANLAQTGETSASAHFVIGYDGEIIQCIPLGEIGYAVKGRNYDSVSIECCYLEENGRFTEATYESLVKLTAWLLGRYELEKEHVLRHYDEGGKNCPKYYVENDWAWGKLVQDIGQYIEENGTEEVVEVP